MKALIEVREVAQQQTLTLRTRVLRPGHPPEARPFGIGEDEETRHFAAFEGEEVVGACYIVRRAAPFDSLSWAWQLRGMAVETSRQGQGIGARIVERAEEEARRAEEEARRAGIEVLWFNARRVAVGFYAKLGFEPWGEEFDIPVIGPHTVMWKRLIV